MLRVNPNRVKLHRSYSVEELARCLQVHKNTVRHWQAKGLEPIDKARPVLFQGATVRAYLAGQNASRKRPCPAGTMFCLRCREPRQPALGMVEYVPLRPASGNLRGLCQQCATLMHRRVRLVEIERTMPECTVQHMQAPPSLSGRTGPSLNCDSERAN